MNEAENVGENAENCHLDKHGTQIAVDDIIKMPIYGVGIVKRDDKRGKLYVDFLNFKYNNLGWNLFDLFQSEVMEVIGKTNRNKQKTASTPER